MILTRSVKILVEFFAHLCDKNSCAFEILRTPPPVSLDLTLGSSQFVAGNQWVWICTCRSLHFFWPIKVWIEIVTLKCSDPTFRSEQQMVDRNFYDLSGRSVNCLLLTFRVVLGISGGRRRRDPFLQFCGRSESLAVIVDSTNTPPQPSPKNNQPAVNQIIHKTTTHLPASKLARGPHDKTLEGARPRISPEPQSMEE